MNVTLWKRPKGLELLAAIFLFCILREWLLPLLTLTDTATIAPFYYIAAGVLLLDLFVPHRWITFPLKLIGILWWLHASFFATPFFDTEWLKETAARLIHDIPLVLQQHWSEMSPISRNFLFDLMLISLISLLSYLVLEQRQGLWFVFLTELYLAVLDTFLPYEADGGIIRTLIFGFLLLAVTHLNAIHNIATVNGKGRLTLWNSLIAPVLIVSLTVGIAYVAPKKAASWPDPVSYFTGSGSGVATGYMKKIGYDNNDERLGGPFLQDDSLVFIAVTNERTYWRGDSKDTYTGVGWEKGDREYESILEPKDYQWGNTLFSGTETKQVKATLEFKGSEQFPTVFYPGQLKRLTRYDPGNATIVYDKHNQQLEVRDGKITLIEPGSAPGEQPIFVPNTLLMKLRSYAMDAEVPIVSEKQLSLAGTTYPEEIASKYLQLPPQLPTRIRELAESVTQNARTPYEKVRAIENYLRTSGKYKYETTDVPVPEQGQDFVDQFLFESFRGYCDHFSSAMAVMLRSIGIPTRWVKGFAPGTRIDDAESGFEIVEVRNRDAHSWVEVYFPGTGWIPFEATSTFTSPVRFKYDLNSVQTPLPFPLPNAGGARSPDRGDGRLDQLEEGDSAYAGGMRLSGEVYAAALAVAALTGYIVWKRRRWIAVWWLQRQMNSSRGQRYTDKYRLLLRLAENVLSKRGEGETLREYVSRLVISGDKQQDLWYLTELYERVYYGYKEIEEKAKSIANQLLERLSQQLKP